MHCTNSLFAGEESHDWISIYYTNLLEDEHKCNICEAVVVTDSKKTDLLVEHVKNIHKDVYDLHKDNNDSNTGFQIHFLQFNMLNNEEGANKVTQPVIVEEITCDPSGEVLNDPVPTKDLEMQYILVPKVNQTEETLCRKRSWVWKYFDKLTNTIYRCKLCNVVLSIKGCNTNNMNRHVRTRHPVVYKGEVDIKTNEKYEKHLEDPFLVSAKQRRSWIWAYFKRVSKTLAQCKLCNRNISHGGNATGNMNRHLKMIHHKTGDQNYWIWKVFENLNEDYFSCKICQYKCAKFDNIHVCIQSILNHLKTEHGVVSGDQIITGAEYEVGNE